jgi:F-type H+-transporting ATPase subunit epsilon
MAKTFHLTVARVGENLFDGEAISATLPATEGVITVLANHEPFVSTLNAGNVRIENASGEKIDLQIPEGGVVEISANQATVLL